MTKEGRDKPSIKLDFLDVDDLGDQNSKIFNNLNDPNLRENEDKDILEKEAIRKQLFNAFG